MAIERLAYGVTLSALCSLVACGQSADSADSTGFNPGTSNSAGSTGNGSSPIPVEIVSPGDGGALPPEKELDQTFRAPVATGKMLWSANPDSGRVALIDAETLAVRMTNAGFGPTYLAAVPNAKGNASAIVLNVGSHDATWLVDSAKSVSATTIPTHAGANSWAISDSGRFAIAWTNAAQIQGGVPDSVNGYSELTVIDLSKSPPTSTRLSVGFRPSQIVFDAAARYAYAVVDEGISVLSLGNEPVLQALIPAGSSASAAHARDVNFAPEAGFAAVRVEGSADIEILSLPSGARHVLTLESSVTDLDVSADGKTATVVLGNENPPKVERFAVPVPETDPAEFEAVTIPGEVVRSVSLAPDGAVAVLYANAVASSHVSLLNTAPGAGHLGLRTVNVEGAVQAVYVSPDSATAITLQIPPAGSKKTGLFSIVPTESLRAPRIVGTDALPSDVVFSDAAFGKALVTVHDSASTVHGVYVIGLANLEQNFIPLSSDPLPGATGVVPGAKRGFVAQKHPEGRITFIDLTTGAAQTLSGFEIAARVVQ